MDVDLQIQIKKAGITANARYKNIAGLPYYSHTDLLFVEDRPNLFKFPLIRSLKIGKFIMFCATSNLVPAQFRYL